MPDDNAAAVDHTQKALLPGDSEVQQLLHTFQLLGTPNEQIWPGVSQLKVRMRSLKAFQTPPCAESVDRLTLSFCVRCLIKRLAAPAAVLVTSSSLKPQCESVAEVRVAARMSALPWQRRTTYEPALRWSRRTGLR